jgi:hypothetical protein
LPDRGEQRVGHGDDSLAGLLADGGLVFGDLFIFRKGVVMRD